ncbi:MAG: ABC transporter ATP-binding protein [Cyanobacteria bacterium P01_A01_bin.45]
MASSRRLTKLVAYMRPHWREVFLGLFALFTVNGLSVYIPLLIRNCINQLSSNFTFNDITGYILIIASLSSAMWLIRMSSRIWLFGVGRQVEFDLKQNIFEHLLGLEPSYFATNTAGDLISRATSDVDNIRRVLGFAVLSLANTIFAYVMVLPAMLRISWDITLAALSVYPFMFLMVQVFSNRLRSEQLALQEEISELSELIQEDVSGIAALKIYAQEDNERRAFNNKSQELLQANLRLAKTRNTIFPLIGGLANVSSLIIILLGAGRIIDGSLDVGNFVVLLIYVQNLVFPTALLGFTITTYQRGEVSIERIEEILRVQAKIKDDTDPVQIPISKISGELRAENLTYTYPGAKTPALDNISFTVAPGETVAIVGAIGSGKTTLANALPRLLDIDQGQLFLDGVDTTKLSLEDLRNAIAYVPQDSFLFSTSIKNNIRYGDPLSEFKEVKDAARMAQIAPEIDNFPQHYETIVGERGITLSGGQRQRTALARAMLVDAPVLILDDALSSVDNQTATAILNNLSGGTKRKTVIFITHQLSAAAAADRIFVMDKGKIVQSGTQIQLLQEPGLYKTLWSQHQVEELLH